MGGRPAEGWICPPACSSSLSSVRNSFLDEAAFAEWRSRPHRRGLVHVGQPTMLGWLLGAWLPVVDCLGCVQRVHPDGFILGPEQTPSVLKASTQHLQEVLGRS